RRQFCCSRPSSSSTGYCIQTCRPNPPLTPRDFPPCRTHPSSTCSCCVNPSRRGRARFQVHASRTSSRRRPRPRIGRPRRRPLPLAVREQPLPGEEADLVRLEPGDAGGRLHPRDRERVYARRGGFDPGTGIQLPSIGKFTGGVWGAPFAHNETSVAPAAVRSASVTLPCCTFFTRTVLDGGICHTLASYVSMQTFPTFTESGGHRSVPACAEIPNEQSATKPTANV